MPKARKPSSKSKSKQSKSAAKAKSAKPQKKSARRTSEPKTIAARASDKARATKALPYRPCAGIVVFNRDGHVFIGRRESGPERLDPQHVWQMPQGGIDKGEDAYDAAIRELYEETSIRSVKKLGKIRGWLTYDLPPHLVGTAWKGKYRGQKQKWFAMLFTGKDSEIDIHAPGGGKHKPEFVEWRWEPIRNLTKVVVPFKRKTYREIVKAFRHFAKPQR